MSKYPQFERVGAGKLRKGDVILVREGVQDPLPLADRDGTRRWDITNRLAPGQYTVLDINYLTEHRPGHRRAHTSYHTTVRDSTGQNFTIETAPVHRINRLTP
jgi:hypothetical protein